ncbi:MAG: CDP-alcohol phosphatidyltransferase family protein [Acidobacteria bacterium]|nr:CDP-alcohol phosphatidyltransferase family protein [Acidobacteriota bacterium]
MTWKTKPTDRFALRFIKLHISAPVSKILVRLCPKIRPTALTFCAAGIGIGGGIAFGLGWAWLGGLLAAFAQILDGVDGQVARLTGTVSARGALLDSVLDRYMDFALLFGIFFHCLRYSSFAGEYQGIFNLNLLIIVAALAAAGSSQISYFTARAASLNLDFKRPEHAGKGSRTTVIIICGLLTPFWIHFPLVALLYLAVHPNIAVIISMFKLKSH